MKFIQLLLSSSSVLGGGLAVSQDDKTASALAGTIEPCVSTGMSVKEGVGKNAKLDFAGGPPPANMQFEQVMGNVSYLLGWTLAGSAVSEVCVS